MPRTSVQAVKALAIDALGRGAERQSLASVQWDIGGPCESPVPVELKGWPYVGRGGDGSRFPFWMDLHVRCRKCPACLKHRARLWAARAKDETLRSSRTWFGTLTYAPEGHYRLLALARQAARARGVDPGGWTPEDEFKARVGAANPDLTLWLKRVRKASGAKMRYVLVSEAHKSGLPHWHCLIHEAIPLLPVRKEVLRSQWKEGFSRWKLCEVGTSPAWYVAKYLAKSALARVRASGSYGDGLKPKVSLTP